MYVLYLVRDIITNNIKNLILSMNKIKKKHYQ